MRATWRLAAGALVVAGCTAQQTAAPAARGEMLRTERDVYRATVEPTAVSFTVVATFTNRTPDTLWMHPCVQQPPFPPVATLERQEADGWHAVVTPVCTQALLLDPPRLAPGESRVDTVRVFGARRPNTHPAFPPGPVAGVYRLVYGDVFRRWYRDGPPAGAPDPLGERLPPGAVASNAFRLEE